MKEWHRKSVIFPAFSDFSGALACEARSIESTLARVPRWMNSDAPLKWIPNADDLFWSQIAHDLSFAMEPKAITSNGGWSAHTLQEGAHVANCEQAIIFSQLTDFDSFARWLERINKSVSPQSNGWRRGPIGTVGADGSRFWFPPADEIEISLKRLHKWIFRNDMPPLFQATVAYGALCNSHPFQDGNGRTARFLVLSILGRAGLAPGHFLPLYEYFARSQGSYAIHLRLAELRGDWDSLGFHLLTILTKICEHRLSSEAM